MSAYDLDIALEGQALSSGESVYTTCPACDRPGKLSITRTDRGSLLYHCFRVSCELGSGGVVWGAGEPRSVPKPSPKGPGPYTKPLSALMYAQESMLHTHLQWFDDKDVAKSRVMWAPKDDCYAFPVFDFHRDRVGVVLRHWNPSTPAPKARTRLNYGAEKLSWYRGPSLAKDAWCIIVEDIPSAARAARYCHSIALLGTACNAGTAASIAARYKRVVWALDDDAFKQALRLQSEHRILFDQSRVLKLDCDLKDMHPEDLQDVLGGYAE